MLGIEICVDVPDLARGIRFYEDAFGFSTVSEPYPGFAVLAASAVRISCLKSTRGLKRHRTLRTYDAMSATGRPCIWISRRRP
jgi:hypothetical protein